jgi:hypothetical protein
MGASTFSFTATLWEHDGAAAWFFLSVPPEVADEIEERFGDRAAGFGSIRVEVTVGATTWRTSLFPDAKRATYVLPVKRAVRVAEALAPGSEPAVVLQVLV